MQAGSRTGPLSAVDGLLHSQHDLGKPPSAPADSLSCATSHCQGSAATVLFDHTTQQLLISQSSTSCSCYLEQTAYDLQRQTAWAVARQW